MKRLTSYYFNHFIQNKYNHLLAVLILFFFLRPFFLISKTMIPIINLVFVLSLILTLRAVNIQKKVFWTISCAGIFAYILYAFARYHQGLLKSHYFVVAMAGLFFIFLALSIVLLSRKMIIASHVDSDTIKGGICIYILIGYAWSIVYAIIYSFDPQGFIFTDPKLIEQGFVYFSFTVLTTVGFGDITPVNPFATSLSSLEALTGQLFIALFISRLLGLHLNKAKKESSS